MKPYYKNELTTIYNGDCLEVMDYLIDKGERFTHVFTSPPYNRIRNDKYEEYNDNNKDYFDLLNKTIMKSIILADYVFVNIQQTKFNRQVVHKIMGLYSDILLNNIIWEKVNPQPNHYEGIVINCYEYILVFSRYKDTLKANQVNTKNILSTPVYSQNPYKDTHRAVMHPDVAKFFYDNFTKEGDTILDPFMGTGTTNYFASQYKLKNTGIELSKKYCDIGIKRLNQLQMRLDI